MHAYSTLEKKTLHSRSPDPVLNLNSSLLFLMASEAKSPCCPSSDCAQYIKRPSDSGEVARKFRRNLKLG